MPGRQRVVFGGLEYYVSPAFWLRRWLRFPFYFESTNPSFRVDIRRVSQPPANENVAAMRFVAAFSDGSESNLSIDAPDLAVGECARIGLVGIYSSHPGQTSIRLVTADAQPFSVRGQEFHGLYSYQVRSEEQLWLAFATIISGAATGLAVFLLQRWLG